MPAGRQANNGHAPPAEPSGVSPGKRKRGRPRKVRPGENGSGPAQALPNPLGPAQPSQAPHHRSPSPSDVVVLGHRRRTLRPVHSLTRTTSTSSKGAPHDPIDVDDAARRRKLVFASDTKPAHSFFTRTVESDGGRAPPAPSSAAQGETEEQPRSVMHSFFQANGGVTSGGGKLREGWGKGVKAGEGWLAPWPGRQCPSHVDAAEPSIAVSTRPVKRRRIVIDDHLDQGAPDYWHTTLAKATDMNGRSNPTATSATLPSLSARCWETSWKRPISATG